LTPRGQIPFPTEKGSDPIADRKPIHAWHGSTVSTKVDTYQAKLSEVGRCGWAGVERMDARPSPRDGFTAALQTHTAPPSHGSPLLLLPASGRPPQVQGAALQSPFPIPRRMGIQSTRTGTVPE
jgi:hypothetical protein